MQPCRRTNMTKANFSAWVTVAVLCATAQARGDVALPSGVEAVWNLGRAYREITPTRKRVCVNGLWRWQPAAENSTGVPTANWGYYKVPACWPGAQDYMQNDYQTLYRDPSWA